MIVYASKYGATQRYAQWLAEELGLPCFEAKAVTRQAVEAADVVLHLGGLYAGRINGLSWLKPYGDLLQNRRVAFVAVGASSSSPQALDTVRTLLPEAWRQAPCFYLRGGLDVPHMRWADRMMMGMMRKMLLKKKPEEQTQDDRDLLASFDQPHDWTDRSALAPIVQWVQDA